MENPNTIINILMVAATVFASIVALIIAVYGKAMENAVYKPKISVGVRDGKGELTRTNDGNARFYHLVIQNNSSKIAHNAVPMLKKIEKKMGDNYIPIWEGSELPLIWQFGNNNTSVSRNIGAYQKNNTDIVSISKSGLYIRTLFIAANMPPDINSPGRWPLDQSMSIVCTVYVKYDEGVSKDYKFEIYWDGKMMDDTLEMEKHFIIKEKS